MGIVIPQDIQRAFQEWTELKNTLDHYTPSLNDFSWRGRKFHLPNGELLSLREIKERFYTLSKTCLSETVTEEGQPRPFIPLMILDQADTVACRKAYCEEITYLFTMNKTILTSFEDLSAKIETLDRTTNALFFNAPASVYHTCLRVILYIRRFFGSFLPSPTPPPITVDYTRLIMGATLERVCNIATKIKKDIAHLNQNLQQDALAVFDLLPGQAKQIERPFQQALELDPEAKIADIITQIDHIRQTPPPPAVRTDVDPALRPFNIPGLPEELTPCYRLITNRYIKAPPTQSETAIRWIEQIKHAFLLKTKLDTLSTPLPPV